MLVKGATGDDAEDGSVEQAMAPPLPPEQDAINTQISNLYIEVFSNFSYMQSMHSGF